MTTSYIKHDNCLLEFKNIPNHSIDFVCVDLPYGQTHCEWDVPIDLKVMWVELKRIIKQGAYIAFFCTTKFGNTLINSNPTWFRYDLVWEKTNSVGFLSANKMPLRLHEMIYIFRKLNHDDLKNERNIELRAYAQKIKKYINKSVKVIQQETKAKIDHFYSKGIQFTLPTETSYNILIETYNINNCEGFMTYKEMKALWQPHINNNTYNPQKTKGKPFKGGTDKKKSNIYGEKILCRTDNKGDRYPTSIVKFPNPNNNSLHPTQKPVPLLEWLIKTYSNENDMVLDFTMGSGSSVVACINTNRRYIGIEMNDEIFRIAESRINEILNSNNI